MIATGSSGKTDSGASVGAVPVTTAGGTTGAVSGDASGGVTATRASVTQEQGQVSRTSSPSGWNASVFILGAVAIVGLLAAFFFFTKKH